MNKTSITITFTVIFRYLLKIIISGACLGVCLCVFLGVVIRSVPLAVVGNMYLGWFAGFNYLL